MKYSIVLVAFVATLASAQLEGIPPCAAPCLTSAHEGSTCGETDLKCLCQDQPFIKRVSQCIGQSCDAADQEAALAAGKKICAPFGTDFEHGGPAPTESSAPEPTGEGQSHPAEKVTPSPSVASTGGALPAPTNGTYTPPVETQAPNSGAPSRVSAAFGLAGLSLLAAAFVL